MVIWNRNWMDDRLQTLVGGIKASVNLDFYGVGRDVVHRNNHPSYNLDTVGGVMQAKYRFGNSKFWAGLGYVLSAASSETYVGCALRSARPALLFTCSSAVSGHGHSLVET
jgi:hypothetical protein